MVGRKREGNGHFFFFFLAPAGASSFMGDEEEEVEVEEEEEEVGSSIVEEEDGKLLGKQLYFLARCDGGIGSSLANNKNVFAKILCYPGKKKKSGELSSVPSEGNWDNMSVGFEGPPRQSMVSVASPLCVQPTV